MAIMLQWLRFRRARDSSELKTLLIEAERLAFSFPVDYVGVEHVFLSFRTLAPDHVVSQTLGALKVNLSAFYEDLDSQSRVKIDRPIPSYLPLTPRLRGILLHARKTAQMNNHLEVLCDHLLYSIGVERASLPASLLLKHFIAQNPQYTSAHFHADLFTGYLAFSEKVRPPLWKMPGV